MNSTLKILTIAGASLIASGSMHASFVATPATTPVAFIFGWGKSKEEKAAEKAAEEAEAKTAAESMAAAKAAAGAAEGTAAAKAGEKANGIDIAELKKKALETMELINSKRGELEAIAATLRAIPLPEQMSAQARAYQAQVASLTSQISDLRAKLEGYTDQLRAMGVPVDAFLK